LQQIRLIGRASFPFEGVGRVARNEQDLHRRLSAGDDVREPWPRKLPRQNDVGQEQIERTTFVLERQGFRAIRGGSDLIVLLLEKQDDHFAQCGVVFYAASPFFINALRDLESRRLGMDVPVAIAIGAAYLASIWSMLRGTGEVYFDSVCMFTFFLLLGRYLEARIRRRSDEFSRRLLRDAPLTARRIGPTGDEVVACRLLVPGDLIRVREGEAIPADGVIVEGRSAVDEALLTGEPLSRSRLPGDPVIGGSRNIESPLVISVTRTGANSTLASIVGLLDRTQAQRPATVRAADRAARVFVAVVLGLTAAVTFYWWHAQPDRAFEIGLALLVSTCPCALSLATPAALAAATNALARTGLLVSRGHVLEGLARISDFVFDKTGTLTRGEFELVAVRPLGAVSEIECVAIARVLEEHSSHPIARAFPAGAGRWCDERISRARSRR